MDPVGGSTEPVHKELSRNMCLAEMLVHGTLLLVVYGNVNRKKKKKVGWKSDRSVTSRHLDHFIQDSSTWYHASLENGN